MSYINNLCASLLKKALGVSKADYESSQVVLAGGAIRSLITNTPVSDLDLFFPTEGALHNFKSAMSFRTEFMSPNCVALRTHSGHRVQLITKRYYATWVETPNEITQKVAWKSVVEPFDFTVCQAAYLPATNELHVVPNYFEHLALRKLHLTTDQLPYPFDTLRRAAKYMAKGYTIDNYEIFRLGMACRSIELSSKSDWKDQIQGFDFMYLNHVAQLDGDGNVSNSDVLQIVKHLYLQPEVLED